MGSEEALLGRCIGPVPFPLWEFRETQPIHSNPLRTRQGRKQLEVTKWGLHNPLVRQSPALFLLPAPRDTGSRDNAVPCHSPCRPEA